MLRKNLFESLVLKKDIAAKSALRQGVLKKDIIV